MTPPLSSPLAGAARRRAQIVAYAGELVGIHEVPAHSNRGPLQQHGAGVTMIQSATGAYGLPWCVSTIQYIWRQVLGSTWANRTAGAYYLADYARLHGALIDHPVPGCAVVYHIGSGHAGTVVAVRRGGVAFTAIEGNEADAVRQVDRNVSAIRCTFLLRPELRG